METAAHEIPAQLNVMTSPMGFAELYERHHAIVYRAALRITGNPADAEDVLQTAAGPSRDEGRSDRGAAARVMS